MAASSASCGTDGFRIHLAPDLSSPALGGEPRRRGEGAAASDQREREDRSRRLSGGRTVECTGMDGLAIGAPVTATLIGVMLARGELGFAQAAGHDEIAAAHRDGADEPGAGETVVGERTAAGPGQGLVVGQVALAAPLDPVSVGPQAPDAAGGTAAPPPGPEMPGVAAATPSGEAAIAGVGGITVNLSTLALGFGVGLELEGVASGEAAPLGAWLGGTDGDDVLIGSEQRDHLEGGAGDDLIHGLGGDDWLDGGAGDDSLFGGAGKDTLLGGTGDDLLDGGAGDDLLRGGAGDDSLLGGDGRDRLEGGSGNDSLAGGGGLDRLIGGAGDDILIVGDQGDLALDQSYGPGGGGRDVLQVEDGFGSGPATFVFGDDLGVTAAGTAAARQQVHGGIENLVLTGSAGHDAIGDGRANSLIGNAGDNALYGMGGDDLLQGGGGADLLDGGDGADRLDGGDGDDMLTGGAGADELWGGAGDDRLAGGLGADLLYGGAGDDVYLIGLHDGAVDTVFDHEGSNHIVLEGGLGHTVQAAILGNDLHVVVDASPVAIVSGYVGHEDAFAGVDLGAGVVAVEDLLASPAPAAPREPEVALDAAPAPPQDLLAPYLSHPSLIGGDGADHLVGTSGADWLQGLAGADQLHGGDGADVLEGGAGSDLLQGGGGDDRYLFRSGESGLDIIRDAEGSNIAELHGFTGARLEGVVVGHDLVVVADYAPVFRVEQFVGNEASFAGIQVDDSFVATDELFH